MSAAKPPLDDELVRSLRKVFSDCDLNNDGVVQKEEIEQIVKVHLDSPVEAQIVALLSHCFEDIKALHKEGWFEKKNGITLGDLFVLENLLQSDLLEDDEENHTKLVSVANSIVKRTKEVWKLEPSLYGSFNDPSVSVRPIAVRRGNVGNCNFLAALAATAQTKPESIPMMIKTVGDGNYSVDFPGLRDESIAVKRPTIVELTLYEQLTRMGYWPCILEKAFNSYLESSKPPSELTSSQISNCLSILTGNNSTELKVDSSMNLESLSACSGKGRAIVAISKSEKNTTDSEKIYHSLHPYTIMEFDNEHRKVTLRDPYGPKHKSIVTRKSKLDLRPRARMRDGIFSLSLNEFLQGFDSIFMEGLV